MSIEAPAAPAGRMKWCARRAAALVGIALMGLAARPAAAEDAAPAAGQRRRAPGHARRGGDLGRRAVDAARQRRRSPAPRRRGRARRDRLDQDQAPPSLHGVGADRPPRLRPARRSRALRFRARSPPRSATSAARCWRSSRGAPAPRTRPPRRSPPSATPSPPPSAARSSRCPRRSVACSEVAWARLRRDPVYPEPARSSKTWV